MAPNIPRSMPAALLHKLHALAERRCAHLIELQQTGRWMRYYSQNELVVHMREAARIAAHWQKLADEPPEPPAPPNEKLARLQRALLQ